MKIAMISEHASPLAAMDGLGGADGGGQNVFVADLAAELGRQGHHVTVYTRRDDPDLPDRVRPAPGVTVEHVPAGPARQVPKDELLPWMPAFGRYLEDQWRADPPDVAHAHFWMSGLATHQAAAQTHPRVPVVLTYHALGVQKRRHQKDKDTSPEGRIGIEREIGVAADAVIATSTEETHELHAMGVPAERVWVVPCGVDLDRFRPYGSAAPRGRGGPVLVALSRLVERKGVDTAIEALAHIPDATLLVAGGPPRSELDGEPEIRRLRGVAEASGVLGRVQFLGRVERGAVPELLRAADVVVALPWYEPFGMVPLEAMACGAPVVATAVGGHLDTVEDGVTGLHVPPRRPEEAARRINELLAAPGRRAAMGMAGAAKAWSGYSWEHVAKESVAVYRRAMAHKEVAA
jgi:glycosyltransferase involved in cell wall biosynthesis